MEALIARTMAIHSVAGARLLRGRACRFLSGLVLAAAAEYIVRSVQGMVGEQVCNLAAHVALHSLVSQTSGFPQSAPFVIDDLLAVLQHLGVRVKLEAHVCTYIDRRVAHAKEPGVWREPQQHEHVEAGRPQVPQLVGPKPIERLARRVQGYAGTASDVGAIVAQSCHHMTQSEMVEAMTQLTQNVMHLQRQRNCWRSRCTRLGAALQRTQDQLVDLQDELASREYIKKRKVKAKAGHENEKPKYYRMHINGMYRLGIRMLMGHAGAAVVLKTLDIPQSRFSVTRCENLLRSNTWVRHVQWYSQMYQMLGRLIEVLLKCQDNPEYH